MGKGRVEAFSDVPVLTFWRSLRCSRLKLWCERDKRLVTFREGRASFKGRGRLRPAAASSV